MKFHHHYQIFFIVSVLILICRPACAQAPADARPSLNDGEKTYQWYCASCHGDKGNGKGFNAKNLDPRPADHTDIELMSKRTDRELGDAITGGGRAVGKSPLMPPWGRTLSEARIESLILYLRGLCGCRGM